MSETPQSALQLGMERLKEVRHELDRLDNKVAVFLSLTVALLTLSLGAVLTDSWQPSKMPDLMTLTYLSGTLLLIAACLYFLRTIAPRLHPGENPSAADYFLPISEQSHSDAVLEALRIESNDPERRMSRQLYELSIIVAKKYRRLRRGTILLGLAIPIISGNVLVWDFLK